jgi:Ca2+/H+ antiporter, TMEM165/GDT1 family
MIGLYVPALLAAFLITLLEMTEVLALVFAISGNAGSVRAGAGGAVLGIVAVAAISFGAGAALIALPRIELLGAAALVLFGFGAFLGRSTLRAYRRARFPEIAARYPERDSGAVPFAGGLTVGLVESTEAAIVLLALSAAGYASSALVGAAAAGLSLAIAAALVHQRIRRIKTRWLKLVGTALLFTYGVFWAGEALGYRWPGSDLFLLPLFAIALAIERGVIEAELRREDRARVPAAHSAS